MKKYCATWKSLAAFLQYTRLYFVHVFSKFFLNCSLPAHISPWRCFDLQEFIDQHSNSCCSMCTFIESFLEFFVLIVIFLWLQDSLQTCTITILHMLRSLPRFRNIVSLFLFLVLKFHLISLHKQLQNVDW